jgi:hypothetical protein
MSGYVTKLKARREECYSLQAGEAPLAFSRRLGGGGGSAAPKSATVDDPATGGSAPALRVDSVTTPSTPGEGSAAGSHLSEVVLCLSLSSSSEDEFTSTGGGERPCFLCNR